MTSFSAALLRQHAAVALVQAQRGQVFFVHDHHVFVAALHKGHIRFDQSGVGAVVALPGTRVEGANELDGVLRGLNGLADGFGQLARVALLQQLQMLVDDAGGDIENLQATVDGGTRGSIRSGLQDCALVEARGYFVLIGNAWKLGNAMQIGDCRDRWLQCGRSCRSRHSCSAVPGCDAAHGWAILPALACKDQLKFLALGLNLRQQALAQIACGDAHWIELPDDGETGIEVAFARSSMAWGNCARAAWLFWRPCGAVSWTGICICIRIVLPRE